ncbi:MAG: hypothetical protein M3186_12815 [Actinomycetota bacterium]|nr:hypothetical protein [Actinomycetota bacterium]
MRQVTSRLASIVGVQGVLAVGLVLLPGGDAMGTGATIAFLIAAPAAAMAMGLRGVDPLARIVIALAAAAVVNTLVAEAMVATGTWSIPGGVGAVGVISVGIGLAAGAGTTLSVLPSGGRPDTERAG